MTFASWQQCLVIHGIIYNLFSLPGSLYCVVPLYRNQFSPISSQLTPHISPVRARYGVSIVNTYSDLCSASVTRVLYAISCYIGLRYNSTRLYICWHFMQVYPLVSLWEVNITLVNGLVLIRPGIHQGPDKMWNAKWVNLRSLTNHLHVLQGFLPLLLSLKPLLDIYAHVDILVQYKFWMQKWTWGHLWHLVCSVLTTSSGYPVYFEWVSYHL